MEEKTEEKTSEVEFKDYKEKQKYYRELSKQSTIFYKSGKIVNSKGVRTVKGKPFIKPRKVK